MKVVVVRNISERLISSCVKRRVPHGELLRDDLEEASPIWAIVDAGDRDFYQVGDLWRYFSSQPETTLEGLSTGLANLRRGWRDAWREGLAVNRSSSVSGPLMISMEAAEGVGRVVPLLIMNSVVSLVDGMTRTIQGVRNEIDPRHRHDILKSIKGPRCR